MGPIGIIHGQYSVAVFNVDIDLMLNSQGYSDIYRTISICNGPKAQPHRAESGEATDGATRHYRQVVLG